MGEGCVEKEGDSDPSHGCDGAAEGDRRLEGGIRRVDRLLDGGEAETNRRGQVLGLRVAGDDAIMVAGSLVFSFTGTGGNESADVR